MCVVVSLWVVILIVGLFVWCLARSEITSNGSSPDYQQWLITRLPAMAHHQITSNGSSPGLSTFFRERTDSYQLFLIRLCSVASGTTESVVVVQVLSTESCVT
eukprot:scpid8342/ scgid20193/ 